MGSQFGDTTQIASILDRLRAGDEKARDELLVRTQERMRFLAERVCKDFPSCNVDEAISGANFRLLNALGKVHPASVADFMRWAAAQMRRELIDLLRRNSRLKPLPDDPSRSTAGPLGHVLCAEFHELIQEMEPEEQDLFNLLYYIELKAREAAELLGVSETEIRRRWNKAAWKLHRRLNA